MKRFFKPGDRVRLRSGGPIMEVIKYIESTTLLGQTASNMRVLCSWYDKKEGRKKVVYHQNSLTKTNVPVPVLFETSKYSNRY